MWCRYVGWNGRKYFFPVFLFGILKFLYICKKNTRMYFNEIERRIIIENKSLYADRMKLHIAVTKLKRSIMKTLLCFFNKLK